MSENRSSASCGSEYNSWRGHLWTWRLAYLALTGHYINDNLQLCTSVLGIQYLSQSHTADNLFQVKKGMMEEWAIINKLNKPMQHQTWLHLLDSSKFATPFALLIVSSSLFVRKSWDQTPTHTSIRDKGRHVVTYFRSNTKEKLAQMKQQMGWPIYQQGGNPVE